MKNDIKNKLDLIVLTKLNNYNYHIFNHVYTSIITLIINTLLHYNYRASES